MVCKREFGVISLGASWDMFFPLGVRKPEAGVWRVTKRVFPQPRTNSWWQGWRLLDLKETCRLYCPQTIPAAGSWAPVAGTAVFSAWAPTVHSIKRSQAGFPCLPLPTERESFLFAAQCILNGPEPTPPPQNVQGAQPFLPWVMRAYP